MEESPSPRKIQLREDTFIGPHERCFIIAEIGQNHQGDLSLAKEMIKFAKECGADCVKFQKTNLPSKFNRQALLRPYVGPHSWGETYGAHKQFLEFSETEFTELQTFSQDNDILFSSSVMDEVSLQFVNSLNVPFIKIGSGDLHNKQLIRQAAKVSKPLLVSTGMSDMDEVVDVYHFLKSKEVEFCLLHCISSYPTPFKEINLNVIKTFQKAFPDVNIGYSGHETGIDVSVAAVAMGAKVIERHFTLDKTWKGSDHACSLTPPEFKSMVSHIRDYERGLVDAEDVFTEASVREALGGFEKKFQNCEAPCFEKLGKSVVAVERLEKGDEITWDNICVKVAEPKGVLGKHAGSIVGRRVKRAIERDESVLEDDVN